MRIIIQQLPNQTRTDIVDTCERNSGEPGRFYVVTGGVIG